MRKAFTPLEITDTNKRHRKFLTGFTLVELLIVLVIIGIIATIALPQYQKFVKKTRVAEAKQVLNALSKAQYIYFMETGEFYNGGGEVAGWKDFSGLDIKPPVSQYWSYCTTHNWDRNYGGPGMAWCQYGVVWANAKFPVADGEPKRYVISYEDGEPVGGTSGATPPGPVTKKYFYVIAGDPGDHWLEGWPE